MAQDKKTARTEPAIINQWTGDGWADRDPRKADQPIRRWLYDLYNAVMQDKNRRGQWCLVPTEPLTRQRARLLASRMRRLAKEKDYDGFEAMATVDPNLAATPGVVGKPEVGKPELWVVWARISPPDRSLTAVLGPAS